MGIQINGQTDRISAVDGSFSIQDLAEVNVTGVATASNFKSGTSNVHSTGYECTNINATGIVTAASANFTGNVSVGGTLTYQDVTNIDSVGVITARSDISIADKIVHTGDTNTAIRFPAADTITAETGGSERLRIDSSGNYKLITGSGGTLTFGIANGVGTQIQRLLYDDSDGSLTIGGGTATGYPLKFFTGNDERLRITSAGNVGINETNPIGDLSITGANGSTMEFQPDIVSGTNRITNFNRSTSTYKAFRLDASQHEFLISGSEKLRITSGGDILIADTTNSVYNDTSGGGINLKANGQIVTKKETTSTADPLVWLNDTGQTTNRTIALAQDGTEKGYLGLTGNSLSLGVNGGDRLLVTDAGMVGINMTPSTTGNSTYMLQMYNAGTQCFMSLGEGSGGNGPLNGLVIGVSNAAHYIVGRENRPMIFSTNDTERVRISSDGKFGIGTANPSNRLHVYSSDDTGEIRLGGGNGAGNHRIFIQAHPSTAYIDSYGNNTHNPLTINAKPLTLNTSGGGAVTIGTTVDNPGDANTTTGSAIRTNGKYFFSCAADGGHINRNNNGYVLHSRHNGNHVGGVYVHTSATSFQTSSDYRLKENVVDLSGAITRVKQLAPKRFNFIIEPGTTVDGFLAHEAAPVVPEAVTGTHNEVDDDGNPVYQGIDQAKLVPLLTAALQEAIAKIETLEAAVTALQGS